MRNESTYFLGSFSQRRQGTKWFPLSPRLRAFEGYSDATIKSFVFEQQACLPKLHILFRNNASHPMRKELDL